MSTLRDSSLPLAVALLFVLSLRPVAPLERALDLALAPTRLLAELALPLRVLGAAERRAADADLDGLRTTEGDAGAALVLDLRAAAEPGDPDLRLGRRLVPAEQVSRRGDDLWVALDPRVGLTGVAVGLPAVVGEAFVGRVAELDPARDRVRIALVTGSDFFVGARLDEPGPRRPGSPPPLRMTVGGLDPSSKATLLAVHNPSERAPRPGLVRVREPDLDQGPGAHLADGYLLGELLAPPPEVGGPWSVRPPVDLKGGLFHVSLLLPADTPRPRDPEPLSSLRDGGWRATRALSVGDPAPGRHGLVISTGGLTGVEPGAAVVATTRLVGRVTPGRPVPPLTARVQLLGEPGLPLSVMARLDADGSPRILGSFTGLGLVGGRPAFAWDAELGLAGVAAERATATLYTGAGQVGVPPGLVLGRATLPTAPSTDGAHVIVLEDWTDGLAHGALWVRDVSAGAGP